VFKKLVVVAVVYLITAPILPVIFKKSSEIFISEPYFKTVRSSLDSMVLEIPAIGVYDVVSDKDESLLWKVKYSDEPGRGNTVIAGHRFTFANPIAPPLYFLDKVVIGDSIIVYKENVKFVYVVSRIYETSPDDIDVERHSDYPVLTVYTCTPVMNPLRRLVVVSNLVRIE